MTSKGTPIGQMETSETPRINIDKIREMLFHDDTYIADFAAASIESFSEFSDQFTHLLLKRDVKGVQRAVHKIRPVATMLELEEIITEAATGKDHLKRDRPDEDLKRSAQRVRLLCSVVIREFEMIMNGKQ